MSNPMPCQPDACARAESSRAWYCIRAQTRREHVAAADLRLRGGLEVFCPRLREYRATRRGPVWFVEALFPGYLFARLDLAEDLRSAAYARGVRGLVSFGRRYAVLHDAVIDGLRAEVGPGDMRTLEPDLDPGARVQVADGPLRGIRALVTARLPARRRVRILLDFLGREMETEIGESALVNDRQGFPATVTAGG